MIFRLILSIMLTVGKSSVNNVYAKSAKPSLSGVFFFNTISYALACLVALCMGGIDKISWPTAICAFFYAAIVFSLQSLTILAMKTGPMSLTSLLLLFGMIIPALSGPIFWPQKETISFLQVVGILIMLASIWLLKDNNKNEKKATAKWWFLALTCFFLSGMAGVMEKIHQSTPGKDEQAGFALLACALMFLLSAISMGISSLATKKLRYSKKLFFIAPISGLIVGLITVINLTLSGMADSMFIYPVSNGGALLLTVLISTAVFKEKPTVLRIIGFVMGLCGIVLLSIPA